MQIIDRTEITKLNLLAYNKHTTFRTKCDLAVIMIEAYTYFETSRYIPLIRVMS